MIIVSQHQHAAETEPWRGSPDNRQWHSGPLAGVKLRPYRASRNPRSAERPCSRCHRPISAGQPHWRGLPNLTRCCEHCGFAVTDEMVAAAQRAAARDRVLRANHRQWRQQVPVGL